MKTAWVAGLIAIAALSASLSVRSQSPASPEPTTPAAPGQAAPPAPEQATSVTIRKTTGPPGGKVSVPLTLAGLAGVKIGELNLTLTFAASDLSFAGAETGGLSDGVGAELKTEPVEGGEPGKTQVRLVLSTLTGEKPTRQALPNGVLLYLLIGVSNDAKRGAVIPLDMSGKATTVDDPPAPVEPIVVKGTTIQVGDTPITSCFFYMH